MERQIIDAVNQGIVLIDQQYRIVGWNRWMEIHSGITSQDIANSNLFEKYPNLDNSTFVRSCKSVFKFGNYIFFSQKLHNYLFPFESIGAYTTRHNMMQQRCTIAPIRSDEEITNIVITVQDVTESVYLENELKMMSQSDSLTGISNRRFFDSRISEEFSRCARSHKALSLLLFDIDDFKRINDNYGHQYGDIILKEIARICATIVRECDIVARYGGEEFCIVLPDANLIGAESFAERLRRAVESVRVRYKDGGHISVTISLGIAEYTEKMRDEFELIANADTAMYEAKTKGKNCVSCFSAEAK
ncbi:MAG: diguanylate cyclase [Spirochaetales bacterium]|nr:diguanylate cyclase [Spirochaetales bacterium]